MSEEKPVLKVTDRRLFNPDGTPRDIERKESTGTTSTTTPAATREATLASPANSSQATPASSPAANASPVDAGASLPSATAGATTPSPSPNTSTAPAEKEQQTTATNPAAKTVAEEDPTAFVNLLMFIASPAAAALGLTEHPGIGADEIDLPLAKHCIDLLGTLRKKTQGSVTAQEDEIFENLLAELRMQFVSLSGARGAAAPGGMRGGGGFSGSDITGGR